MANRSIVYLLVSLYCAALVCTLLFFYRANAAKSVARAEETVSVVVYIESLCPGSRDFMLKQIKPNYPLFASRMELQLIPYGNAEMETVAGEPRFTCQHGKKECRGNTIQACAIKILDDPQASVNFVSCAFKEVKQESSIEKCLNSTDVQNKVKQCADGEMGTNLMYEMGNITIALRPPNTFTPWVTFNGEGGENISDQAGDNFVKTLCTYYKDDLPKRCMERVTDWDEKNDL